MKRFVTVVVSLLLITTCMHAQDLILKRDNTIIKANVLTVKSDIVTFKKFENPQGPTYELNKNEIIKIVYKNNTEDVFLIEPKKDSTQGKEEISGNMNINNKADSLNPNGTQPRPECEIKAYGTIQVQNTSKYPYDLFIDNVNVKRLEPKSTSGKIIVPEGNNRCLTVSQVTGYLISPTIKTTYINVVRCSSYNWQIP
jgi:hypothetical protein